MGIRKRFYQNTRCPRGIGGKIMLHMMNKGHNPLALWAMSYMDIQPTDEILDIGCGGGRNISNLLERAPQGHVCGVDYSQESVRKSASENREAIRLGQVDVQLASVSELPFSDGIFDIATAFETIYFWPDIMRDFSEVRRVLKVGGTFMICNDAARPDVYEKWIDMLNLNVYTAEELKDLLTKLGFDRVVCREHPDNGWLCVTAQKAECSHDDHTGL